MKFLNYILDNFIVPQNKYFESINETYRFLVTLIIAGSIAFGFIPYISLPIIVYFILVRSIYFMTLPSFVPKPQNLNINISKYDDLKKYSIKDLTEARESLLLEMENNEYLIMTSDDAKCYLFLIDRYIKILKNE